MTKSELKDYIKECISEYNLDKQYRLAIAEVNNFNSYIDEDMWLVTEGKAADVAKNLIERLKKLVIKIKDFLVNVWTKFVNFIKSIVAKLKSLNFKKKVDKALATESKNVKESALLEITGADLKSYLNNTEVKLIYNIINLDYLYIDNFFFLNDIDDININGLKILNNSVSYKYLYENYDNFVSNINEATNKFNHVANNLKERIQDLNDEINELNNILNNNITSKEDFDKVFDNNNYNKYNKILESHTNNLNGLNVLRGYYLQNVQKFNKFVNDVNQKADIILNNTVNTSSIDNDF